MEVFTLGIDLGKTTFHLVGMNQRGEVVLRKRFSRVQLLLFTANLKVKLIGMEACGGSHFLGRALRALVQIFDAGMAGPLDWPGVHAASTAFQIVGAVRSLMGKRRSENWFLPMRRSSSMPAIVVTAQS